MINTEDYKHWEMFLEWLNRFIPIIMKQCQFSMLCFKKKSINMTSLWKVSKYDEVFNFD